MKQTNREQKRERNKSIAILGVSAALIIVLQALAEGLRVFGLPLSLALGLIPVLVVAQLRDVKSGVILGTVFGLTSFVIGVIQMSGVEGAGVIAFNPLVTVLPRTLVGLVCGAVAAGFARLNAKREYLGKSVEGSRFKRFSRNYLQSAVATLCGVLTNTIGFLGMMFAFAHGRNLGGLIIDFRYILAAVVAVNTVVEAVSYVVIVPAIVQALRKARVLRYERTYHFDEANAPDQKRQRNKAVPTVYSILLPTIALVAAIITGLVLCLA